MLEAGMETLADFTPAGYPTAHPPANSEKAEGFKRIYITFVYMYTLNSLEELIYIYIYIYIVCVCVCERERERERGGIWHDISHKG